METEKSADEMRTEIEQMQRDLPQEQTETNQEQQEESNEQDQAEQNQEEEGEKDKEGEKDDEEEEQNVPLFDDAEPPKKDGEQDDENEQSEEDGISQEDAKIIDSRIQKALEPYKQRELDAERKASEAELNNFLSGEGEIFKSKEAEIKAVLNNPKFASSGFKKEVRIAAAVALGIGWKGLLKIGAQREREARNKAKASETGGGSSSADIQNTNGVPDISRMNSDNFQKFADDIKSGRRVI